MVVFFFTITHRRLPVVIITDEQTKLAFCSRVGDYKLIDGYPGLYPDWYKPDQLYKFKPEPSIPEMQAHAGRYQLFNLRGKSYHLIRSGLGLVQK